MCLPITSYCCQTSIYKEDMSLYFSHKFSSLILNIFSKEMHCLLHKKSSLFVPFKALSMSSIFIWVFENLDYNSIIDPCNLLIWHLVSCSKSPKLPYTSFICSNCCSICFSSLSFNILFNLEFISKSWSSFGLASSSASLTFSYNTASTTKTLSLNWETQVSKSDFMFSLSWRHDLASSKKPSRYWILLSVYDNSWKSTLEWCNLCGNSSILLPRLVNYEYVASNVMNASCNDNWIFSSSSVGFLYFSTYTLMALVIEGSWFENQQCELCLSNFPDLFLPSPLTLHIDFPFSFTY